MMTNDPANPKFFHWVGGAVIAIFAFGSLWSVTNVSTVGSPDEAINAFFIREFAMTNQLTATSFKLSAHELSYWHPRSVRVDGDALKPGSFLGLVLAGGGVDKVFGSRAHLILTPLLAILGLWALYRILRRFWSPPWPLLGVGLVAVHPVWWQFQTLPLYHNGAFVSLLILAGWRLMVLWEHHQARNAVWFGLAYGAALFFRPIEVLWTAPLVAIVLLAQRQWMNLGVAALVAVIVQAPWMAAGYTLYGTLIGSGYAVSGADLLAAGTADGAAFSTPRLLTPPGGWSWNWLHSFWNYFVLLVPAWSVATAAAIWFYLRRISNMKLKVLKISLVSLGLAIPFVYYGTWNLYPLETPQDVGSLASYARYWLPMYVPMVVGVLWLLKRIANQRWFFGLAAAGLFVSQIVTIIWHPNAGVLDRLQGNQVQNEKREMVLAQTSANSAIVAGHMDKLLFPDRIVAFDLPKNETEWVGFVSVLFSRPVYLYVTPRQYNLDDLNATLARLGFTVGERSRVLGDELWELKRL